ncbi:MAG: hypothetical protein IJM09_07070 [Neisseriaceae bacterium]|nr:hypothetical protein [Neisseriaceae bacterium]
MPLQRLTALVNDCVIDWIATIFPTEKSRNDTGFILTSPYGLLNCFSGCLKL